MSKFCYSIDNLPTGPLSAEYPAEVNLPLPPDASPHVLSVTDQGTVRLDMGCEKPVVLPLDLRRVALEGSQQCQEYLGRMGAVALRQGDVGIVTRSADDFAEVQEALLIQIWATVLIALEPAIARIRAQEVATNAALLGRLGAMSQGAATNVKIHGGDK